MESQGCTEKDVVDEVARCLKYAPDRKGGGGRAGLEEEVPRKRANRN